VHPVARAWIDAQDQELIRAIRRAFCHHRGYSNGCPCLSRRDRELIAEWVTRAVMRGCPSVIGRDIRPRMHLQRGVQVVASSGRLVAARTEAPSCWFPRCGKAPQHAGQHHGVSDTGRHLLRLAGIAKRAQAHPVGSPAWEQAALELVRQALEVP